MNTRVLVEVLEKEFGIPGAQQSTKTGSENNQLLHSLNTNESKRESSTSNQAQESQNENVAGIMLNGNAKLEGNAINAGNIIGKVGTISGQLSGNVHKPTSTADGVEKDKSEVDNGLQGLMDSHNIGDLYTKFNQAGIT